MPHHNLAFRVLQPVDGTATKMLTMRLNRNSAPPPHGRPHHPASRCACRAHACRLSLPKVLFGRLACERRGWVSAASPLAASSSSSPFSESQQLQTTGDASKQVQLVWRIPSRSPQGLCDAEARDLTNRIKACRSWEALAQLCERHGRLFNHTHLSAAVTHLAQLHAAMCEERGAFPSTSYSSGTSSRARSGSTRRGGPPSTGARPGPGGGDSSALPVCSELPPGAALLAVRLLRACERQLPHFSARKVANVLWAAAKLGFRPTRAWVRAATSASCRCFGSFRPQHVANVAYALSLMGVDPGRAWLAALADDAPRAVPAMKGQELANLAHALPLLLGRRAAGPRLLATLGARAAELLPCLSGQELALTTWGLARLASGAGHEHMLTRDGGLDRAPSTSDEVPEHVLPCDGDSHEGSSAALEGVLARSICSGQEHQRVGGSGGARGAGLSELGAAGGTWGASALDAASAARTAAHGGGRPASGGGGSTVASDEPVDAVGDARPDPRSTEHDGGWLADGSDEPIGAAGDARPAARGWLASALSMSLQRMHAGDLSTQGLSLLLLACDRLRAVPPDGFMRAAQQHAAAALAGPPAPASTDAPLAHAAGGVGLLGTSRGGDAPGAHALSNLLLGLARVGHAPPREWMLAYEAAALDRAHAALAAPLAAVPPAAGGQRGSAAAPRARDTQHAANTLWCMSRLRWAPSAAFVAAQLALVARAPGGPQPVELAQLVGALARMRVRVSHDWLGLCCGQVLGDLESLDARGVCVLLSGLAWQGYAPDGPFLRGALGSVPAARLNRLPTRTLAQLAHALAALGHRPPAAWSAALCAALAPPQAPSPLDAATLLWHHALLRVPLEGVVAADLARVLAHAPLGGVGARAAARAAWALRQLPLPCLEAGSANYSSSGSSVSGSTVESAIARLDAHAGARRGGRAVDGGVSALPSEADAPGNSGDAARMLGDITAWASAVIEL